MNRTTPADQTVGTPAHPSQRGRPLSVHATQREDATGGYLATISHDEMAELIRGGLARRLTRPAGRGGFLVNAVLVGNAWYAVMDGAAVYERVSDAFNTLLTILDAAPAAMGAQRAPGEGAGALIVR